MPHWKNPRPDFVQGYWIKNLSNMHTRIALQLDRCVRENNLPKWMIIGKTLLCVKGIKKGSLVSNFRPFTCLPLIWMLIKDILAEELYRTLKKQIHYYENKRDAEKEAEEQNISYLLTKL